MSNFFFIVGLFAGSFIGILLALVAIPFISYIAEMYFRWADGIIDNWKHKKYMKAAKQGKKENRCE